MKSSTVQRVLFLLIPVNKDLKQIHIWERQKYCQFRLIKTFRKVLFYSTVLGNRTIYGSWDMKCTRQNCFAILGHFLLFYSPNSLKNKSLKKYLKKKKKRLEISSFYTSVPKTIIIGYTVLEIWHVTGVIVIFHFGLYFSILPPPPKQPKKWKIQKMKKKHVNIIILHKCTKNHDHMLCCSWDMLCDRCNCYFSFWVIFCPFNPLRAQKIKISKNEKVPGDTIILHKCAKNNNHMLYSPFLQWPLTAPKMKFQRNEKKPRDIIILHMYTRNYD